MSILRWEGPGTLKAASDGDGKGAFQLAGNGTWRGWIQRQPQVNSIAHSWNCAYGSGERGGITISRRPNKCPSTENAPGPNKAIPMAVTTISRVTSVRPSEASGGPGIQAKAIQRTERPASKLASGVKKPRIKPAPLRRNRPETTQTSGVRSANPANSRAPSDTAMPPRAVRKRSSATPGLPLGKVENSRCSGSLRSRTQTNARNSKVSWEFGGRNPPRRESWLPLSGYWDETAVRAE